MNKLQRWIRRKLGIKDAIAQVGVECVVEQYEEFVENLAAMTAQLHMVGEAAEGASLKFQLLTAEMERMNEQCEDVLQDQEV